VKALLKRIRKSLTKDTWCKEWCAVDALGQRCSIASGVRHSIVGSVVKHQDSTAQGTLMIELLRDASGKSTTLAEYNDRQSTTFVQIERLLDKVEAVLNEQEQKAKEI